MTFARILGQVARQHMNVVKARTPLMLSEQEPRWFTDALEEVLAEAEHHPPRSDASLGLELGAAA